MAHPPSAKCGDRRDVPRFLKASEPTEKLVNVPSVPEFCPTVSGKDRDEYPPAVFKEGGSGADVRTIDPSDNGGAGSSIGNQISDIPEGTTVQIKVEPRPEPSPEPNKEPQPQ